MRILLTQVCIATCLLTTLAAGAYVTGTPGGPWTKEELLIVRSKLLSLFASTNSYAPQTLRLSFHDCFLYEDRTGGCDGCLNWDAYHNKINTDEYKKSNPNVDSGAYGNRGIKSLIEDLERVYTEADYPEDALKLKESLIESGKSRADLWAFAGKVSVEWGIEANNLACEDWNQPNVPSSHCVHEPGTEECYVRPSKAIQFEYGRADCTNHRKKPYKSKSVESHPNAIGDGIDTIEYFKNDFGFTGRETVAIMGAHTFGNPTVQNSMFMYTWTSSALRIINNDYYKSIIGLDRWFIDDADSCKHVGDAFGNKPKTRWVAHSRKMTERGGPVFWLKQNHVCASLKEGGKWTDNDRTCVADAGPGQTCVPDPAVGTSTGSRTNDQEDGNTGKGCERFRLISGKDEIALNCEMGLYFNFTVTDGIPQGCEGLEHFPEQMANDNERAVWSGSDGTWDGIYQPKCGMQDYAEPAGSTPTYQIMEEYAHNNTLWIDDFTLAFEKMTKNGYGSSDLQIGPDTTTNVHCPIQGRGGDMLCYEKQVAGTEPAFMIGSRFKNLDNKVLQYDAENNMFNYGDITQETNQQWRLSEQGNQLINEMTGEPYTANMVANFDIEQQEDDVYLVYATTGEVVDCIAAAREGKTCSLAERDETTSQKFYMIPL